MNTVPDTAMVLAAGLGSRMRPLTETTAKPLLKVGGRRMISYLLSMLAEVGVRRAVVNVHWFADDLETYLTKDHGVEIVIADERSQLLETGGALAAARSLLGKDPIFVVNTDAFWAPADPAPLEALSRKFNAAEMDECLMLADIGRCLGYKGQGDFHLERNGLISRRRPSEQARWAYAGIRILKPQLYDDSPVQPFSANRIWDQLLPRKRMTGLPLDRFWLHVGDPQALKDADMWVRCHGT
ncbi:MAG: nucleotidyltransferase family protein [Henriciella sp.]|jgi:MurNAc alpha-1-phosphate uridylyltransferase